MRAAGHKMINECNTGQGLFKRTHQYGHHKRGGRVDRVLAWEPGTRKDPAYPAGQLSHFRVGMEHNFF